MLECPPHFKVLVRCGEHLEYQKLRIHHTSHLWQGAFVFTSTTSAEGSLDWRTPQRNMNVEA